MKQHMTIEVRGKDRTWGFPFKGDPAHMEAWRADGLNVSLVVNTIPLWAQRLGLTRIWCRAQDGWGFLRFW